MNKYIFIKRRVALLVATGCGTGFTPVAPGTVGSLAALLVWGVLAISGWWNVWFTRILLILCVSAVGLISAAIAIPQLQAKIPETRGKHNDPAAIVIDEWAGLSLTLLVVAPNEWGWALGAFVAFRFFDILKPGPVGWAERAPGAVGIMLDDLVAGACAAAVLMVIRFSLMEFSQLSQ